MNTPPVDSTVAASVKPAQTKVRDSVLALQPVPDTDQPDFAQMLVQVTQQPKDLSTPQTGALSPAILAGDTEEHDIVEVKNQEPHTQARDTQVAKVTSEKDTLVPAQRADTNASQDHRAEFASIETAAADRPTNAAYSRAPVPADTAPSGPNDTLPVTDQNAARKAPFDPVSARPDAATHPAPTEKAAVPARLSPKVPASSSPGPLPPKEAIQKTILSNPSPTGSEGHQPNTKGSADPEGSTPVSRPKAAQHTASPAAMALDPHHASRVLDNMGVKEFSPRAAQQVTPPKPEFTAPDGALPPAKPQVERPVNLLVKPAAAQAGDEASPAPPALADAKGAPVPFSRADRASHPADRPEPTQRPGAFVSPLTADIPRAMTKLQTPLSDKPERAMSTIAQSPAVQVLENPQEPLATPIPTKATPSSSTQLFTLVARAEPSSPTIQNTALPLTVAQAANAQSTHPSAVASPLPAMANVSDFSGPAQGRSAPKPEGSFQTDQQQTKGSLLTTSRIIPASTPVNGVPQPVEQMLKTDPAVTLLVPASEGGEMLHWDPARVSPIGASQPVRNELTPHIARQMAEVLPHAVHRPVEIALSPQELGRVRMSITTEDGAVTVNILAERADTLDLMRRNIEQLGQSFRSMGYDQISFSFGQGMRRDDHSDGADQGYPQAADLNRDDGENTPALTDLNDPVLRVQTTGIDIRL